MLWGNHMPEDYVKWLKEEGDNYQDGWEMTFIELSEKTPEVNASWEAEREEFALKPTVTSGAGHVGASGENSNNVTPFKLHNLWFEGRYKKEFSNFICYSAFFGTFFPTLRNIPMQTRRC